MTAATCSAADRWPLRRHSFESSTRRASSVRPAVAERAIRSSRSNRRTASAAGMSSGSIAATAAPDRLLRRTHLALEVGLEHATNATQGV